MPSTLRVSLGRRNAIKEWDTDDDGRDGFIYIARRLDAKFQGNGQRERRARVEGVASAIPLHSHPSAKSGSFSAHV